VQSIAISVSVCLSVCLYVCTYLCMFVWPSSRKSYKYIAQLSLKNPRDALHHGKRQNFKSHVAITTPFLWVICHPVARIDIAYPTLGSSVPVIWLQPPKFLMGHMTWPRPYQGRFVVRRLWLAHSTCTSNLKSLRSPITKMHKATQNVEIEVV